MHLSRAIAEGTGGASRGCSGFILPMSFADLIGESGRYLRSCMRALDRYIFAHSSAVARNLHLHSMLRYLGRYATAFKGDLSYVFDLRVNAKELNVWSRSDHGIVEINVIRSNRATAEQRAGDELSSARIAED